MGSVAVRAIIRVQSVRLDVPDTGINSVDLSPQVDKKDGFLSHRSELWSINAGLKNAASNSKQQSFLGSTEGSIYVALST